jgi:hypothetical protein
MTPTAPAIRSTIASIFGNHDFYQVLVAEAWIKAVRPAKTGTTLVDYETQNRDGKPLVASAF